MVGPDDAKTRTLSDPHEPRGLDEPVAAEVMAGEHDSSASGVTLDDLPQLSSGAVVGRYTVLGPLGRGGMGVVYKAYDPQLDRNVALKVMRVDSRRLRSEHRLLREAQMLARLQHPNVVAVFDAGLTEGGVFIAMELCEGWTLREWLHNGTRSVREILAVFRAAGRGLVAVHAAGFVHRDFKPSNVLVGYDGSVRVLDFGIALLVDPASRQLDPSSSSLREVVRPPGVLEVLAIPGPGTGSTEEGLVVGTPQYMAPEQVMGDVADHRSEQFSFCVCLHVALYGCSPVVGDTLDERRRAIAEERGLDPRRLLAGPSEIAVPTRVRRALLRGLSLHPEGRFPSMAALLEQLEPAGGRWPVLAAALVSFTGMCAWAMALSISPEPCADPVAALEGVWSDDDRAAVRAAFDRSGHIQASSLHARVEGTLDDYAAAWTAMYTESCRATFVTQQQSERHHDHRMRCLQRRRDRMRAAIDSLAAIDGPKEALDRTVVPFVLPPLSECADLDAVTADNPLPSGPRERERIEALRRRISEVETLQAAGELPEALERAQAVVDEARELGFSPVLAEALGLLGSLQAMGGSARDARVTLEAALHEAARAKDDLTAAESWTWLLYALLQQDQLEQALTLELAARTAVERADDDRVRGWLFNNLGAIHGERGSYVQARRYLQKAVAIKSRTLGPEHVDVGISWTNLGAVLVLERRYVDARDAFERAQAVFERTVGSAHPLYDYALANLCQVEEAEGRYAEAVALCARVLEHFEASPSSSVSMANGHWFMARALHGAGRSEEARVHGRRALELAWAEAPVLAREIAAWLEAPPGLQPADEPAARAREREAGVSSRE